MTFVVHLMQGGRLLVDEKKSAKPRAGQARFMFERPPGASDPPALLLTEQGTERKAGVWCVPTEKALVVRAARHARARRPPRSRPSSWPARFAALPNTRLHSFLRDQHAVAGLGRRLANEVCHRAKLSPFAMTHKLDADAADAIVEAIRRRPSTKDSPRSASGRTCRRRRTGRRGSISRTGEPCPVCGDPVRAVEYASYTVNYCPTCQTGGKVLADNTTSRFLR